MSFLMIHPGVNNYISDQMFDEQRFQIKGIFFRLYWKLKFLIELRVFPNWL